MQCIPQLVCEIAMRFQRRLLHIFWVQQHGELVRTFDICFTGKSKIIVNNKKYFSDVGYLRSYASGRMHESNATLIAMPMVP
jgi:hypothetical protein